MTENPRPFVGELKFLHVITRNKAEQGAKQPTQRDVVILNTFTINNNPSVMDCYVTSYKKLYNDNKNFPHNDMKRFVPSPLCGRVGKYAVLNM